jgi:hypothetical protein
MIDSIDWEMTPDLSFGTYESWGGRERVRNNDECVYYFYIDNWGTEPKLCLMERAVKHARIVAEIKAPPEMVKNCVESQGVSSWFEKSYAINEQVRSWLIANVLEGGDGSLVIPVEEEIRHEDRGNALPLRSDAVAPADVTLLPGVTVALSDDQVATLLKTWNFFDAVLNPQGRFGNVLVAGGSPETVVDLRTSLMWQTDGLDICSLRMMKNKIKVVNDQGVGGFSDWRLPTLEEAMSLMEPVQNGKDIYLNLCFSREQPFVFTASPRKPGGHWFVDYKQGRCFWSSATIPGGFGRLVRSIG